MQPSASSSQTPPRPNTSSGSGGSREDEHLRPGHHESEEHHHEGEEEAHGSGHEQHHHKFYSTAWTHKVWHWLVHFLREVRDRLLLTHVVTPNAPVWDIIKVPPPFDDFYTQPTSLSSLVVYRYQ